MTTEASPKRNIVMNPAAAICAAVFIALAAPGLGSKSFWIDEMRTGYAAFCKTPAELLRYAALNDPASPLYSFIIYLWKGIAGNSDISLRIPSLFFGAASIFACFALARKLLPLRAAIISTALFSLSPNLLFYSQEARVYTALLFVSICAYSLTLSSIEKRRASLFLAFVFVAGIYLHVFFAFVIATCALLATFPGQIADSKLLPESKYRASSGVIICAIAAALAYIPWLMTLVSNSQSPERLPGPQLSFLMRIAFVFAGLITGNAYSNIGMVSLASFSGIALLIYGFYRYKKDVPEKFRAVSIFLFTPVVIILVSYILFSKYYDMFHFRYVIPVLPFIFIAIAAGIDHAFFTGIAGSSKKTTITADTAARIHIAFFVLLFTIGSYQNMAAYRVRENQNWRGAFNYIDEHSRPGDTIILQSISSSSIGYYAALSKSKRAYNFIPANSINSSIDYFIQNERNWFVYYRPSYGPNWFFDSQAVLDSTAVESVEFPGLYGNVTVGFTDAKPLLNDLAINCPDKQTCDFKVSTIFKNAYKFACRPDNDCEIQISTPHRKTRRVLNNSGDSGLDSEHYSVKVKFKRADKFNGIDIIAKKKRRLKEEGAGPEMRHYFLDWVKK